MDIKKDIINNLYNLDVVKSLRVGDKVTSDFYLEERYIVRTITRIEKSEKTGSGLMIWADNGGICSECKRPLAKSINGVDGAWFLPIIQ